MMSKEDEKKVVNLLLEQAVEKLNKNYSIIFAYNRKLSANIVYLVSLYKRFNSWNEDNREIRRRLLEEIKSIQNDAFMTEDLANEYLIQLLVDLEDKLETIPLDIDKYFNYNLKREFPSMLGYTDKYIVYQDYKFKLREEEINKYNK